jgi:hypothetical protein
VWDVRIFLNEIGDQYPVFHEPRVTVRVEGGASELRRHAACEKAIHQNHIRSRVMPFDRLRTVSADDFESLVIGRNMKCLIGLGGGSLVKYCYRNLPGTRIVVIEIDPEVIALRNANQPVHGEAQSRVARDWESNRNIL